MGACGSSKDRKKKPNELTSQEGKVEDNPEKKL